MESNGWALQRRKSYSSRKKTNKRAKKREEKVRHQHSFPSDKALHTYDAKMDMWSVKCEGCDFVDTYQEL